MNTQKLEDEFVRLVEVDPEAALQLITGMFVGLTLEYTRRRGFDPEGDVKINGGSQRDITIHAAKSTGHCAEKKKPGGCQRHNLQCGYPDCDTK